MSHQGYRFGFVDNVGSLHQFSDDVVDRLFPSELFGVYDYGLPRVWPARFEDGINRMPTVIYMAPISEHIFQSGAGVYDLESDVGNVQYFSAEPEAFVPTVWDGGASIWDGGASTWDIQASPMRMKVAMRQNPDKATLAAPRLAPLDSFIRVGLFRLSEQIDVDELVNLQTLSVSANESLAENIFEDYINDYLGADVFADWNVATGDEDWGEGRTLFAAYHVKLKGTIDGFNVWENQEKEPSVIQVEGRTKYFDGNVTGLYHVIDITAFEVDETYQIKLLELELLPVGRLK